MSRFLNREGQGGGQLPPEGGGNVVVPHFTVQPSIGGSLIVGGTGVFDFGAIAYGEIGGSRLLKADGQGSYVDAGDASGGSVAWTSVGSYKLRVLVQGSSVYADSAAVTVAAAVAPPAGAIATPVISQTSAAGANPTTFQLQNDASYQPGFYLWAQRSATGVFPPLTNDVVLNGDSFEAGEDAGKYAGAWMVAYRAAHPEVKVTNLAQGGRPIGVYPPLYQNSLTYSEALVISLRPGVYFAGCGGANDLGRYSSGAACWADEKAHFDRIKAGSPGTLIVHRTQLALQQGAPAGIAQHNANRAEYNALVRAAFQSGYLDGLVDLAANSRIGTDAAMIPDNPVTDTTISNDGTHLYRSANPLCGNGVADPIFANEMNRVCALMPRLVSQALQQLTTQDLAGGELTLPTLTTPASGGRVDTRVRIGHEDGAGGYVWGDWSNVYSDTVEALFWSLDTAGSYGTGLTFPAGTGGKANKRATATTGDWAGVISVEHPATPYPGYRCASAKVIALPAGAQVEFGLCNYAVNRNGASGSTNDGVGYLGGGAFYGGPENFGFQAGFPTLAVGDIVTLCWSTHYFDGGHAWWVLKNGVPIAGDPSEKTGYRHTTFTAGDGSVGAYLGCYVGLFLNGAGASMEACATPPSYVPTGFTAL